MSLEFFKGRHIPPKGVKKEGFYFGFWDLEFGLGIGKAEFGFWTCPPFYPQSVRQNLKNTKCFGFLNRLPAVADIELLVDVFQM